MCVSGGAVSARVCDGRVILVLVWSVFWVAVSPGVPLVGCAYLNLLYSPGLLRVLVTLAAVMGPLLPDFLSGAVVVLGFVGRLSQTQCLGGRV